MAVSITELYEALVDAGAPKEQARRAAEAVVSRHEAEHQLASKADLIGSAAALRSEIALLRNEMLAMKTDIIKWNVGTIIAAVGLAIAIVKLIS